MKQIISIKVESISENKKLIESKSFFTDNKKSLEDWIKKNIN